MKKEFASRIEKWDEYRKEIYGNSYFFNSIINEDKEVKTILQKLQTNIKNFPIEDKINDLEIKNTNTRNFIFQELSTDFEDQLLDQINKLEQIKNEDFSFIDKYNFSINQFDEEIEEIQKIEIYEKEKNEKN
ncbi:hypothetical protein [Mycoplasma procyoni]|uniref:hypothetical protein n=1 Tax=Mycoplasma procyoni TaxID=568784 RepID=UPI00197CA20C|nr:hypothetical protein [Mycoplasma procyoni]MBN3534425.1 hypothetical protein [Mycoplasma procyoni]